MFSSPPAHPNNAQPCFGIPAGPESNMVMRLGLSPAAGGNAAKKTQLI
jgi:hypothetical protein